MKERRDPDGNQDTLTSSCLGSEEGEAETRFPYKFLLLKVAQEPSSAGEGGWVCLLLSAFPPFPASALQPDRTEERWRGGGGGGREPATQKENPASSRHPPPRKKRRGIGTKRKKEEEEKKDFGLSSPSAATGADSEPGGFFFFPSSAFLSQRKDFHSGKKRKQLKSKTKPQRPNTRKSKTNNEQSC